MFGSILRDIPEESLENLSKHTIMISHFLKFQVNLVQLDLLVNKESLVNLV